MRFGLLTFCTPTTVQKSVVSLQQGVALEWRSGLGMRLQQEVAMEWNKAPGQ